VRWGGMQEMMDYKTKMIISVALDIMDLALTGVSYILGVGVVGPVLSNIKGIFWDLIMGPVAIYLWGPIGAAVWGEILLPEEIDAFIPALTIAGLVSGKKTGQIKIPSVKECVGECKAK
jgi:hypothetical protein